MNPAMVVEEPDAEAIPREEFEELQVDVIAGRRNVLGGVRNTVRALLRIRTPAADAEEQVRPPISVACVLDRSYSMQGKKLEFAKKACKKLVKHLDASDTLHFISYGCDVKTIFEHGDLSEQGKENLKAQIQEVRAKGNTNLYGALERAAELLGAGSEPSPGDQVKRIFLFSDGCVNTGVTEHGAIISGVAAWAAAGITTTTFGIGADFDEPLMRGIADAGKGRYTFLATANDIPRLVSKSIHDLLKLYASEAALDIQGRAHTTVSKVYGAGDDEDDESGTASAGLLQLGDLHSANERMVLLELECCPPGDVAADSEFQAAEWDLRFQKNGAPAQLYGSIRLSATRDRASLGEEDATVRAMFTIRKASDMEEEVAVLLGRRDRNQAKKVKDEQVALLTGALEAAHQSEIEPVHIAALEKVLERSKRVAERMESNEDSEMIRRHCVQESSLARAMSVAGFSDGQDSSDGSDEDMGRAALRTRLRDFDDDDDLDDDSDDARSVFSLQGLNADDTTSDDNADGARSRWSSLQQAARTCIDRQAQTLPGSSSGSESHTSESGAVQSASSPDTGRTGTVSTCVCM
eukprot:TRINITY_DN27236_c0_g1_i1.p1 TRINITY_DN27236_c0_g1~~TRINITY_DN27236_c0_g1_i1.p1  ORF type:complete len:580 (-),score=136.54 TRINITY_DN27236_c0_g1_i1:188-1927(-)